MRRRTRQDPATPRPAEPTNNSETPSRPTPTVIKEGTFLLPWIWTLDPTAGIVKAGLLMVTVVGWLSFWNLSSIMTVAFPHHAESHWDERHGIPSGTSFDYDLFKLVQTGLDLPAAWVHYCVGATAGFVVLLVVADVLLATLSTNNPYPASWKTENTLCYHDMFSEPSRLRRLLRRPGNTLSNATYLLASLCVLASCYYHATLLFWWADLLFGIMLLVLAISSCLWHGSNGPWTQYVDIWAMDACILYLIVRSVGGLGLLAVLVQYTTMDPEWAQPVAGSVCAAIYGGIIVKLAQRNLDWYQRGYLHGHCPFSVRARLLGTSNLHGSTGHVDCRMVDVALFASMPVIYYAAPLAVQILLLQSFGSVRAGDLASRTLVVGWTYRFWDRWIFDGHSLMNFFNHHRMRPSWVRTMGAAIFSPTAVLHALTGITLLAGYVHSRSLEEQF